MDRALILVVDDQPPNVQAVGSLLTAADYDVMPALSGEQALARCKSRVPSLVLLDMRMPGMDGFQVCQALRDDPRTADVPIIFLTAAHERETLVEAFRQGAVDYVAKPFVAEELLARVRTHLDLKRARDELSTIAQERADLTQIVAHDLKNPLASILSAVELIESRPHDAEERARVLATIRDSANRCVEFIDTYLGKWALSDSPRRLDVQPLMLSPLVRVAVEGLRQRAANAGVTIGINVADDPRVVANATAVRHVLDNLISNALRYGARGGQIDIKVETGRSGMGRVSVSDRGPGVPADKRPQLFKRYVRAHEGESPRHSSGLGLAISKQEIGRMGGHLWYEDRAGGGATFSFVLPLALEHEQLLGG